MAFMMETDRLILQVEKEDIADQLLDFYIRNRKQFERFEPTRPNNFYTLAYQKASLRYEYNEIMHGKEILLCNRGASTKRRYYLIPYMISEVI